jgi:NADPH-dependent 2,4-dienoyl-CoA reductase/sulfur reductase-like enzyme
LQGYINMSVTYELAVIGAGPAGMEAAIIASEAGVKTVVIDSYPQSGGQYFKAMPAAFSASERGGAEVEGDALAKRLAGSPVTRFLDTLVWGIFEEETKGEGWMLALHGPDAPKEIRAHTLIFANGAYETPVAFPGWTLPGVINCGAALILVKTQRVAPGKRALVTGTGPLLFSAAAHLIAAGVEVVGVCENTRLFPKGILYAPIMLGQWGRLVEGIKYFSTMMKGGTPYKTGWSVIEARGKDHVEEAVIAKIDDNGVPMAGTEQTVAVDTVVCGYGLTPNIDLARMIGCKLEYNPKKGGWIPVRDVTLQTSLDGVYVAGDGGGIGGAENSRLEGRIAGTAVAQKSGHLNSQKAEATYASMRSALAQQRRFGRLLGDLFSPKLGLTSLSRDETLICRCEEITKKQILAAIEGGCESVIWVKRATRAGMGMCQGRSCGRQVAHLIAQKIGQDLGTLVPDTQRPPERPIPLEVLIETDK